MRMPMSAPLNNICARLCMHGKITQKIRTSYNFGNLTIFEADERYKRVNLIKDEQKIIDIDLDAVVCGLHVGPDPQL